MVGCAGIFAGYSEVKTLVVAEVWFVSVWILHFVVPVEVTELMIVWTVQVVAAELLVVVVLVPTVVGGFPQVGALEDCCFERNRKTEVHEEVCLLLADSSTAVY